MTIRTACVILFAGFSCHGQSLSGTVLDQSGSVIPGTLVVLESESDPSRRFQARADDYGIYRFSQLSADVYRLRFEQAGFVTFFVNAVQLASGETRSMLPVMLKVASNGCSGGVLTYSKMPPLPFGPHAGNLAGQVVDYDGTPVADADASLICGENRVCTKIRTDLKGEFVFEGIPPGDYGLLIGRSFFYPWFARSLQVSQDYELMYRPISLERCPEKYCDPRRRPKPDWTRIAICL